MNTTLQTFLELPSHELHLQACAIHKRRSLAEWELAVCLVAIERRRIHQEHGCGSVVAYAEKFLYLDAPKALELVRIGRLLEHLPLLSQAFRQGEIGYCKLREISRVATSRNEGEWLEFAKTHNTREVEQKVVCSPRAWSKAKGHQASCIPQSPQVQVVAEVGEQCTLLQPADRPAACAVLAQPEPSKADEAECGQCEQNPRGDSAVEAMAPLKFIRLQLTLTPDQYAVVEAALLRLQRRKGKRVSREVLVTELASNYLAQGDSRTKARHPVVVNVVAETGKRFYATERGCYEANEPGVEDAHARTLPQAVRKVVYQRAGWKCEVCHSRVLLEIDHVQAVAHGGKSELSNLQVLCRDCHQAKHLDDYRDDLRFQLGRAYAMKEREGAATTG